MTTTFTYTVTTNTNTHLSPDQYWKLIRLSFHTSTWTIVTSLKIYLLAFTCEIPCASSYGGLQKHQPQYVVYILSLWPPSLTWLCRLCILCLLSHSLRHQSYDDIEKNYCTLNLTYSGISLIRTLWDQGVFRLVNVRFIESQDFKMDNTCIQNFYALLLLHACV